MTLPIGAVLSVECFGECLTLPIGPILSVKRLGGTLDFAGRGGFNGGLTVGQPFGGPDGEVFAVDFRVVPDVDRERRAN